MQKTLKELRNIAKLNKDWANSMSSKVYRLGQSVSDKKENSIGLEWER